nr:immunoglobulin heavy chain junction region [Mus musculus]
CAREDSSGYRTFYFDYW